MVEGALFEREVGHKFGCCGLIRGNVVCSLQFDRPVLGRSIEPATIVCSLISIERPRGPGQV